MTLAEDEGVHKKYISYIKIHNILNNLDGNFDIFLKNSTSQRDIQWHTDTKNKIIDLSEIITLFSSNTRGGEHEVQSESVFPSQLKQF